MAVSITQVSRYSTAGNVYVGVTTPADQVIMTHTAGAPLGGTDVGATIGESTVEYRPTIATVDIEQAFGGVAPRLTAEACTLKFTCGESTHTNLRLAMQQGTATTDGTHNYLTAGGKTGVVGQCVAIISKQADTPQYNWVCVYNAVSMDGLSLTYKKSATRQIGVTMTALSDANRTAGDQLFQYVEEAW
jgi:hypothetical protein